MPDSKGIFDRSVGFRLDALNSAAQQLALQHGQADRESGIILVPNERALEVQTANHRPAENWPVWAIILRLFAEPEDRGLGDTIFREIGDSNPEDFKRFHEAIFGLYSKPCECRTKRADWNALYPYEARESTSDLMPS